MLRALAVLLCLAGAVTAEPLRIGTESDYRPYIFIDASGDRAGFDVDLMQHICERGAFACDWTDVPFEQIISGVAEGAFDISIGGIGTTPERDRLVDWTIPYRVASSSTGTFASLTETVDLGSVRISVQGGTVQESVLQENGYTSVPYPDVTAALEALFSGEVQAFFGSSTYLARLVDDGEARLFDQGTIEYPDEGPQIAVAKTDPELRAKLDGIVQSLHEDGTITLLNALWFPDTKAKDL